MDISRLASLTPKQLKEAAQITEVLKRRGVEYRLPDIPQIEEQPIWTPSSGPQSLAYHSPADELFYGGSAGGGKTDLLLGVAGTAHRKSVIFRRIFPSLRSIIERSREIYNRSDASHAKDSYNEQLHLWRLTDKRIVELGAMQYENDKEKWRGNPHDLYAWDELPEFSETQFRFTNAWNRTTIVGQRCRILATGNPPTMATGRWVIIYWGPWLDPKHPNPALPGELRWYATIDGRDTEVVSDAPIEHNGDIIKPRSRSFIPARLDDNPFLRDSNYKSVIQALPEPLRSQMLYGDFGLAVTDDPYQVIPTAWIEAAMRRWVELVPDTHSSVGIDVARGGSDKTVIVYRFSNWFSKLIKIPGAQTPTGDSVAQAVISGERGKPLHNVDVIGVGASAFDALRNAGRLTNGVNFGEGTNALDKSGRLSFRNVRAAAYWSLREALDPESGQDLMLPDDQELLADLCSPRWSLSGGKITLESKDDIKERLGRSPDCADAVVLAWWGAAVSKQADEWIKHYRPNTAPEGILPAVPTIPRASILKKIGHR